MRYIGSVLAMLTLLAAAWAGSIDNSATRDYVSSSVATHAANTNLHIATGNAYSIAVTGATYAVTAGNAVLFDNLPSSSYVTNGSTNAVLTGTLNPTNSVTVTNALQLNGIPANRYPTNLAVDVTDPWHVASNIMSYSQSTVTLSRAMGEYISLSLTNNAAICIDQSTYPTNGMAFINLSLYIGAYSLTFCTNSISTNTAAGNPPGSGGVTLTNNAWNSVLLHRPYGSSNVLWGIRQ